MFGLENRGETLIFMSRHFDETMTILIPHFLRFGALTILTCDYFVLRTNQIIAAQSNCRAKRGAIFFFKHMPKDVGW